jgi:hypothetical protein
MRPFERAAAESGRISKVGKGCDSKLQAQIGFNATRRVPYETERPQLRVCDDWRPD